MASNRLYRKVSQPYFARKAEGAGDNDTSEYLKEQEDGTVVLGKEDENKVLLTENDGIEFQVYGSESETPHELKMIPINAQETFFGDINAYNSSTDYNGFVFRNDSSSNIGLKSSKGITNTYYTYPGEIGGIFGTIPARDNVRFAIYQDGFIFAGKNVNGILSAQFNDDAKTNYDLVFYLEQLNKEIKFNLIFNPNNPENEPVKSFDIKVDEVSLVEANPTTTDSSETLTSIGIGGTNYKLPSGGSSSGGMESFVFSGVEFTESGAYTAIHDYNGFYTFSSYEEYQAFKEKITTNKIVAYIVLQTKNDLPLEEIMVTGWFDMELYTGAGGGLYLYAKTVNVNDGKVVSYKLIVRS